MVQVDGHTGKPAATTAETPVVFVLKSIKFYRLGNYHRRNNFLHLVLLSFRLYTIYLDKLAALVAITLTLQRKGEPGTWSLLNMTSISWVMAWGGNL